MDTKTLKFLLLVWTWSLQGEGAMDWKAYPVLDSYLQPKGVFSIIPLAGGESYDQIFKVHTSHGVWVLRKINSRRSFEKRKLICEATHLIGEKGLGPKVIWYDPSCQFLITEFIAGENLTSSDFQDPILLRKVAFLLQEAHKSLVGLSSSLKPYSLKERVLQRLKEIKSSHKRLHLWQRLKTILESMSGSSPGLIHADIKGSNILKTPTHLFLIDWGEVAEGDFYDDLGSLAFHFHLAPQQEEKLLYLYFGHTPSQAQIQALKRHRCLAEWHHRLLQIRNKNRSGCGALTDTGFTKEMLNI